MAKTAVHAKQMVITYNKGKANEFNALKGIDVEIYPREYIILFGPSGCGKSTLLYTVLGGIPPDDGNLIVFGEDVYAYSAADLNRYQQQVIGIVYQQFNLISSISVLDNVALPRIFLGKSIRERNERARVLLRRFGIPERLEDKTPVMMSGGQQQRVAVARALVNDPEILLADEPVGNLDSISAEHVMDSLETINSRDRKTVILVTHDAKYLPYAHRVIYMRDGIVRRIVVNPEKEQVKRVRPGETIVTEIEQLARLYPYAEPVELKVKSLVNFATQHIGFSQIQRLEQAILNTIKGAADQDMFFNFLIKPIGSGGVGLEREDASYMTRRVFNALEHSREVQRFRESVHDDSAFMHQKKYVDRLLEFLREDVGLELSAQQMQAFSTAISERVGGILTATDFEERLVLNLEMGGVGFSEKHAYHTARHLEKLIAQGAYIILPNELLGAHS